MSFQLSKPVKDARGKLIVQAGEDAFAWAQLMDYPEVYTKRKSKFKESATLLEDFNSVFKKSPYDKVLSDWVPDFREWVGELWAPSIVFDELKLQKSRNPYHYYHNITIAVVGARLLELWITTPATAKRSFLSLLLHDLGKSRVDSFILDKRGALNDDEWKVMHEAPVVSYVLNVAYWGDPNHLCSDIALNQHENRLGKGYPRGQKTNSLILDILTVVDRFDALTSVRPFRDKAYTHREAFDLIKQDCDDGKIEGEVLKALVALIRQEKITDLKKLKLGTIGRKPD